MQGRKGMYHGHPWRETTPMDDLLCKKFWPLNFRYTMNIQRKTIYFCLLSQVVYTVVTSACEMSWRQYWVIITIIKTSSNLKINTFMVKQRWWYLLPLQLMKCLITWRAQLKNAAIFMNIEMLRSVLSTKMKDRRWIFNLYNREVSLTWVTSSGKWQY